MQIKILLLPLLKKKQFCSTFLGIGLYCLKAAKLLGGEKVESLSGFKSRSLGLVIQGPNR